jgi:hypothetical protein
MDLLQTWLVVGVPGLLVAAGAFVGHARVRAWLGYLVLAVLVIVFGSVPGGGGSAVAIGAIGVLLLAGGRGTRVDRRAEHHQTRRRYTTAGG